VIPQSTRVDYSRLDLVAAFLLIRPSLAVTAKPSRVRGKTGALDLDDPHLCTECLLSHFAHFHVNTAKSAYAHRFEHSAPQSRS
jgi:hypothetical protein